MSAEILSLVALALVVGVSGAYFLLETLVLRDSGAGRLWAVGFLAGVLTTFCYMVWALSDGVAAWIAVAVGNTSFVAATGLLWLGARGFNKRTQWRWPVSLVVAGATLAAGTVLWEGVDGGAWAGWQAYMGGVVVFGVLSAIEARRGRLGTEPMSIALMAASGFQAAYFATRMGIFVVVGAGTPLFDEWFGSTTVSLVSIVLTVVTVLSATSLRRRFEDADRSSEQGRTPSAPAHDDDIVDVLARARGAGRTVALIALHVERIDLVGVAFGRNAATRVIDAMRSSARRRAPIWARVQDVGEDGVIVACEAESTAVARREAEAIRRLVLDDLVEGDPIIVPVLGVGLVMAPSEEALVDRAIERAMEAAILSAGAPDARVVVADPAA